MRLTTKFLVLMGVLFTGIMWGVNSAEKGIQTIQGPKEAQAQSQTTEQQGFQITRIDGANVETKSTGIKDAIPSAFSTGGNENWLSSLGNGLRAEVVSVARSSYLWVVKQL